MGSKDAKKTHGSQHLGKSLVYQGAGGGMGKDKDLKIVACLIGPGGV